MPLQAVNGQVSSRIDDIKDEFLEYLTEIGILHTKQSQVMFKNEKIPSSAKLVFLLANYISELDPSSVFDLSQKIFENWRFKNARRTSEEPKRPRFKTYSVGNLKFLEKPQKETVKEQGISFGIPNETSQEDSINPSTLRREDSTENTRKSEIFIRHRESSPTTRMRFSEKSKENLIPFESNFGTFGNSNPPLQEQRTRTRSLMDFHKESTRLRRSQACLLPSNQNLNYVPLDSHNQDRSSFSNQSKVQSIPKNHPNPPEPNYEYERLLSLKQKINDIRERIQKEPHSLLNSKLHKHPKRKSSHYRDSLSSLYKNKKLDPE